MSLRGKRSLRTKFLLSLTIGAVVMTFLGAFATYHIASQQLQAQLVQRGRLLASAINHSAMIASNEAEFAHVAGEVMRDNPEVTGLVILSQDGKRTIFEEHSNPQAVSRETSEGLKAEARDALNTGTFGLRPSDGDYLQIVVPLTTPIGMHNQMSMADDQVASGTPQQKQMMMPGPASNMQAEPNSGFMGPANQSMAMGTFGAVLMTFDRNSITQSLNAILWRLLPTSLIGVFMTLALCYLLLYRQVLKPIGGIRGAMVRQQSGQRDARAEPQSSLEIDDVASTLNRMLDTLKEREDQIEQLALNDPLTGLANRTLFKQRLQDAFALASRAGDKVAVLFLDLDRFKVINDTYGHPAGDALLKEVARRLEDQTRNVDTVARLGGDEFAIIATGFKDLDYIHRLALRIIDAVSEAAGAAGLQTSSGTSIGITIYPDDAEDTDELLRRADVALYQAKDAGRGVYRIYDDLLHTANVERQWLQEDLSRALDAEDQLFLQYQPQIDIKTGELVAVEALVRWRHPERGLVSPAELIPAAEASNQMVALGDWILSTACCANRAWQEAGMAPFRIAVNVSAKEIQLDSFADRVGEILAETGLEPQWLELEITETTVMSDLKRVSANFHKLAELGVDIAIDDFGTGHSSLTNLRLLPFGKLKIDQSFVFEITENSDDRAITEAVINIGRNLGLVVIAEGVETQAQLRLLEKLGCDLAQGYDIGRPMGADDLAIWIAERMPDISTAVGFAD